MKKNERSLSEVLSEVLKASDFYKLEKIIKIIEEKRGNNARKKREAVSGKSCSNCKKVFKMLVGTGCIEAEGKTNNAVYKISDCINEKY